MIGLNKCESLFLLKRLLIYSQKMEMFSYLNKTYICLNFGSNQDQNSIWWNYLLLDANVFSYLDKVVKQINIKSLAND